jgi:MFS family permease
VSDVFNDRERSTAMAVYTMGPLLGPVLGPIAGAYPAYPSPTPHEGMIILT